MPVSGVVAPTPAYFLIALYKMWLRKFFQNTDHSAFTHTDDIIPHPTTYAIFNNSSSLFLTINLNFPLDDLDFAITINTPTHLIKFFGHYITIYIPHLLSIFPYQINKNTYRIPVTFT
jgi:hypothetical protein